MRGIIAVAWAGLGLIAGAAAVGCENLPDVPPEAFACEDDLTLEGGELPCGSAHWCVEGACTPRLGCVEPAGTGIPDCTADLRRCEPVVTAELSAVRCEGGVHTNTSTRPVDSIACSCPDGLHCVAYLDGVDLEGEAFAPDLRFLPEGGPAPGVEIPERRLCVRACSAEGNCSADHTCRPALVSRPSSEPVRDSIAVCYPNVLAETSSTSTVTQPIARACRQAADCDTGEVCQYRIDRVADHPVVPIGPLGWGDHFALVARCVTQMGDTGPSCTNGNECFSGICLNARCRASCDPAAPEQACGRRNCRSVVADRTLGDGRVVQDRVHVCDS